MLHPVREAVDDIWNNSTALTGTAFLFTLLLFLAGALLLMWSPAGSRRRDLGVAFVTGACFTIAAVLLQLSVEASNFRMTVAVSDDLTGFDPQGRDLESMTFAGKSLRRAELEGVSLAEANLAEAQIVEADLKGADFTHANLFYALLRQSRMDSDTNFERADLRGAELATPAALFANLHRAQVHRETCWDIELQPLSGDSLATEAAATAAGQRLLNKLVNSDLQHNDGDDWLGHVCEPSEQALDRDTCEDPPYRVLIGADGRLEVQRKTDRQIRRAQRGCS